MPAKVRIVDPKGRFMVISGKTDFATIKEKGRELLVVSDICDDGGDDGSSGHRRSSDRTASFSDEVMQKASKRRESYDVQFSLSSSCEARGRESGAVGGGGRVVKIEVEWLPPRSYEGEREEQ